MPVTDDTTDAYPTDEEEVEEEGAEDLEPQCPPACSTHTSCENCTDIGCMWCSNERRCVESNSYVASFPYGQCMEWTTQQAKCPGKCCATEWCAGCHLPGDANLHFKLEGDRMTIPPSMVDRDAVLGAAHVRGVSGEPVVRLVRRRLQHGARLLHGGRK